MDSPPNYKQFPEPSEDKPVYASDAKSASATPVESYLDTSFIDRTSPRLKQTPMTGNPLGEKPTPKKYVPAEGVVIPEVVIRQRVVGPEGRDYNAVVSVIVPAGPAFAWQEEKPVDKTISTITVSREQAPVMADMLADTIAAVAFENNLMVPEGSQGIPLDPNNPLAGLGSVDYLGGFVPANPSMSAQDFAHTMQDFASSSLDPMETVTSALGIVIDQMPEGPRKEKAKAAMQPFKEVLKKAMDDINSILDDKQQGSEKIIKDEAFDTQNADVPHYPPTPDAEQK